MSSIPELAVVYEDKNITDFPDFLHLRSTSYIKTGIHSLEDFYSLLLGSYGIEQIIFIDGTDALNGDISNIYENNIDHIIFIAMGYIPNEDEIEDMYSCENDKGRLVTHIKLSDYTNSKPSNIKEVFKLKYNNILESSGMLLKSVNDLIKHNKAAIDTASGFAVDTDDLLYNFYNINIIGNYNRIYIHKDAVIYPNVILDATNGTIIIDEGSVIKPFSRIEGQTYIGKNCRIESAKIFSGTSVFDNCIISGTLYNSIINSNTVISAGSFIEDAYIGEYVFAAPSSVINGDIGDAGSIIGDFCCIESQSIIYRGSNIGFGSKVSCNGFVKSDIPPFISVDSHTNKEYNISDFIEYYLKFLGQFDLEAFDDDAENILKYFSELFSITKVIRDGYLKDK